MTLDWSKNYSLLEAPENPKQELDIFFQPALTWMSGETQGIALLFLENATGSTNKDKQDFRELVKSLLRWTWSIKEEEKTEEEIAAATAFLQQLQNAYDQIETSSSEDFDKLLKTKFLQQLQDVYDQFVKTPFSYEDLGEFLKINFNFNIKEYYPTDGTVMEGTVFPMFPELSLTLGNDKKTIDFQGTNLDDTKLKAIKDNLSGLKIQFDPDSTNQDESTEELSISKFIFRGYAHLLLKNILQSAIDYLENNSIGSLTEELLIELKTNSISNLTEELSEELLDKLLEKLLGELDKADLNPYKDIAGMASRFLMHGLRLPILDSSNQKIGEQSLYQATGQQFKFDDTKIVITPAVTADSDANPPIVGVKEVAEYKMTLKGGNDYLKFSSENKLDYTISNDEHPLKKLVDDFNGLDVNSDPFPTLNSEHINLIPWHRDEPLRFTLNKNLIWKGLTTTKHLLPLPISLQTHLKQFEENPKLGLKVWPSGNSANEYIIPNDNFNWATSIELPIQQIITPDGVLSNTFDFNGITEGEKDLLEAIINKNVTPFAIHILYFSEADDMHKSIALDAASFLLKANLSRNSTEPFSEVFTENMTILKLIWEGSSVTTGGYYLNLPALSDIDLFKKDSNTSLKLIIEFEGDEDPIYDFNNTVVLKEKEEEPVDLLWENFDFELNLILAESAIKVPVLIIPPGFLGFQITHLSQPVSDPDSTNDEIQSLYHLLGYKVVENDSFYGNNAGLPTGPTENLDSNLNADPPIGDWLYERMIPTYKLETIIDNELESNNPYKGLKLNAKLKLNLWWQDIYGNSSTVSTNKEFPLGYTDPLIGINQWPSVVESFEFKKVGEKPQLGIELAFDPSPYFFSNSGEDISEWENSEGEDSEWEKKVKRASASFQRIYFQLKQDDIDLSVTTSIDNFANSFTVTKDKVIEFVKRCYDWLNGLTPINEDDSKPGPFVQTIDASSLTLNSDFIFEVNVNVKISRNIDLIHPKLKSTKNKIKDEYSNVLSSEAILTPKLKATPNTTGKSKTLKELAIENSSHPELLSAIENLVFVNLENTTIFQKDIDLVVTELIVEEYLFDIDTKTNWEAILAKNISIKTTDGDSFSKLVDRFQTEIRKELLNDSIVFTPRDLAGILVNSKDLFKDGSTFHNPPRSPLPHSIKADQTLNSIATEIEDSSYNAKDLVLANLDNTTILKDNISFIPQDLAVDSTLFQPNEKEDWEKFVAYKSSIQIQAGDTFRKLIGKFQNEMSRVLDDSLKFTSADLAAVLFNENVVWRLQSKEGTHGLETVDGIFNSAPMRLPGQMESITILAGDTLNTVANITGSTIQQFVEAYKDYTNILATKKPLAFSSLPTTGAVVLDSISVHDWNSFVDTGITMKALEEESLSSLAQRIQSAMRTSLDAEDLNFSIIDLGLIFYNTLDFLQPNTTIKNELEKTFNPEGLTLKMIAEETKFFANELVEANLDNDLILKKDTILIPAEFEPIDTSLLNSVKPTDWTAFTRNVIHTKVGDTFNKLVETFHSRMKNVLGDATLFSSSSLSAILANGTELLIPGTYLTLPKETPAAISIEKDQSLKTISLDNAQLTAEYLTTNFVQTNAQSLGLLKEDVILTLPSEWPLKEDVPDGEITTKEGDTFQILVQEFQSKTTATFSLSDLATLLADQTGILKEDTRLNSGDLNLKVFAKNFEDAFTGLRLAVSEDKNKKKDHPEDTRQPLFAVQIRTPENVESESFTIDILEEQPYYFSIPPLSNTLFSDKVAIYNIINEGELESGDEKQFDAIDINVLARNFLVAVEDFLVPESLISAHRLYPNSVKNILESKATLATAISNQALPILLSESPNEDQNKQAKKVYEQELLLDLVKGYDTETVVQYKVELEQNDIISSLTRVNGKAKVVKVWKGEDPTVLVEVEPREVDFSFSSGKFELTGEEAYFTYLFDTKTPEKFASLHFELEFVIAEIEYDIKPLDQEKFPNHEASNWLSFVRPEKMTQKMGRAAVPIPLRNYPTPPSLILQKAEADPTSLTKLEDVRQWKYTIIYEHLDIAQDSIDCLVEMNVKIEEELSKKDLEVNKEKLDLFKLLINFGELYPLISKDLSLLKEGATVTDEITIGITVFDTLISEIASAWKNLKIEEVEEETTDTGNLHYEISEEPLAGTDKQGLVKIIKNLTSKIGGPDPLPVLELPGYKEKMGTVFNDSMYNFTFEVDTEDLTFFGDSNVPDRKFIIENFDVIEHQNAWAKIWLSRNKNLVFDKKTNPAFIFQTPAVRFTSMVTPFITNDEPWNIATLSSSPSQVLLKHLEEFIKKLFPKPADINYEIRLSCRYSFALTLGKGLNTNLKPTLPLLMGLRLNPKEQIDGKNKLDEYPNLLEQEIKIWFNKNKPSKEEASLIFSVNLFSKLEEKSTTSLPMLRIKHLELNLNDVEDL